MVVFKVSMCGLPTEKANKLHLIWYFLKEDIKGIKRNYRRWGWEGVCGNIKDILNDKLVM